MRPLPPGWTVDAIGRRLRDAGDAVAERFPALARVPQAVARGAGGFWSGLSISARRRLAAVVAAVAVLLAFFALAVPNLPCQLPGGDPCPPADDASELVPGDALAYLHANLDRETEQGERIAELAAEIPVLSGQIAARALARIPARVQGPVDFEREIGPWFGGELAVAVIAGGGGGAQQVELLEVADAEAAGSFADEIGSGSPTTATHEGVELVIDDRGLATAQVEDFLAIGSRFGVQAVIETAVGVEGRGSIDANATAAEIRAELPEHRFAEAYVSEKGAADLIEESRGGLGSLAPLIAPGASRGAAASLTATDEDAVELAVRSAIDPERAASFPGFFDAFPSFEPELTERLDVDALGYVGIGEPATTIRALRAQASAQAPGVAAAFARLADRLRRERELNLERELLEAFSGEAAFVMARQSEEAERSLPYLEFVADDVDEQRARRALASLQGPLAAAVDTGRGLQAPVFGQQQVAGVEATSLRISPTVELTYAVFEGLAVVASDPTAIEQLAGGEGGLDGDELFARATEGFDGELSLLAFLDLGGLVSIGEQLGLAEDPVYATFAGEFRRLDALGIAITREPDLLATDARLLLAEASAGESASAPGIAPSE